MDVQVQSPSIRLGLMELHDYIHSPASTRLKMPRHPLHQRQSGIPLCKYHSSIVLHLPLPRPLGCDHGRMNGGIHSNQDGITPGSRIVSEFLFKAGNVGGEE